MPSLVLTVCLPRGLGCSLNFGWREVVIKDPFIAEYLDSFILSTLTSYDLYTNYSLPSVTNIDSNTNQHKNKWVEGRWTT